MTFPHVSGQVSPWGCGLPGSGIARYRPTGNRLTSVSPFKINPMNLLGLPWLDPKHTGRPPTVCSVRSLMLRLVRIMWSSPTLVFHVCQEPQKDRYPRGYSGFVVKTTVPPAVLAVTVHNNCAVARTSWNSSNTA